MKHNIYISLHACSATVRLLHPWAEEATLLKQTPKDRIFTQLARYNRMHERVLSIKTQYQKNRLILLFFSLAHINSSPAAWAKDLSSEDCFRSITWFGDTHYLSTTSPHSIQCAWNSRIWNFGFRKILLPVRNLWNFAPCKRFRPVRILESRE